jgi:putative ABC transport system substrate-binding protein
MKRRQFISLLGGAVVAYPLAAHAQPASVPKVGFVYPGPEARGKDHAIHVLDGLRSEGFREPEQVVLLTRVMNGDPTRAAPILDELIAAKVDILVPSGPQVTRAASAATSSIPIVTIDLESDPVETGLLTSLSRPGGNVTGVFLDFPDFGTTWLGLLREAVPHLASVSILWDPATSRVQTKAVIAAAQRIGIKINVIEVKSAAELDTAIDAAAMHRADGLVVLSSPIMAIHSRQIAEVTLKHHLPTIFMFPEFAIDGGLMAYGPDLDGLYRELGVMAGKVLKGSRPAELPAERPTRFELIINSKTAKTLELTIPGTLLARADGVIE